MRILFAVSGFLKCKQHPQHAKMCNHLLIAPFYHYAKIKLLLELSNNSRKNQFLMLMALDATVSVQKCMNIVHLLQCCRTVNETSDECIISANGCFPCEFG